MKILRHDELPKEVADAPEDNLLALYKTCLQMENLCLAEYGVGLAAVQVGMPWHLFVVRKFSEGVVRRADTHFRYFVNCSYEPVPGTTSSSSVEGCLSIRSALGVLRQFQVERYGEVVVRGKELVASPELALVPVEFNPGRGLGATVFQHEIDHGFGILISDNGKELAVW